MSLRDDYKRTKGRYYTVGNPFRGDAFARWAVRAGLKRANATVVEPFAGDGSLSNRLAEAGYAAVVSKYDIAPAGGGIRRRDTLQQFPEGYRVCVTNPPWFGRSAAARRGLSLPPMSHDNLYKHCLAICLAHCSFVAALVPASFVNANFERRRLVSFIAIHQRLFADTAQPVGLALFADDGDSDDFDVWHENDVGCDFVGTRDDLEAVLARGVRGRITLKFNDPRGPLGLWTIDAKDGPRIRFCVGDEIPPTDVKGSSRSNTRIGGDLPRDMQRFVAALNRRLARFRSRTRDAILTPYRELRADGVYRRRIGFAQARAIITATRSRF